MSQTKHMIQSAIPKETDVQNTKFAICYCFDRDYITGNAPYGLHIIQSSNNYESLVDKLKEELKERESNSKFEFEWNLEYRLCILEYSEENNLIKVLKMCDHDTDFWIKQISLYPAIN